MKNYEIFVEKYYPNYLIQIYCQDMIKMYSIISKILLFILEILDIIIFQS